MKKISLTKALVLWLAVITICDATTARADDEKEYLVKAAMIYNFIKTVQWPDERSIAKLPKIDICVLGDSLMAGASGVFKKASSSQLSIELVEENSLKNIALHCHVVFISASEEGRISEIINALRSSPVLTISDMDRFIDRGGMIGFVNSDKKIKFSFNLKTLKASGLQINPQVLQLALQVIN